jgi:hypothetical protein
VVKARRPGRRPRPDVRRTGDVRREHWREDGRPKARFAAQADANRWALQMRLEEGADLHPYPCSYCGGWHLGTRRS